MRRSRLLAALLFAASPAAGGTLLPVIHPCPVDTPWLVEHGAPPEHAGHHAGHHAAGQDAAPGHHHRDCHCIGHSLAGLAVLVPATGPASVAPLVITAHVAWPTQDASLELAPAAALLPPSTAPPAPLG